MKIITVKQQKILDFIAEFTEREHMAPTVYEIADHAGIKTSTVFAHVRTLQRKGKLTRTPQTRSIKLTGAPQHRIASEHIVVLPLENELGRIGEMRFDRRCGTIGTGGAFAFRIPDEAMRDFGIFTGNVVIIRPSGDIAPDDLAAVKIGEKTMVRSIYRMAAGQVQLRPAINISISDYRSLAQMRGDV